MNHHSTQFFYQRHSAGHWQIQELENVGPYGERGAQACNGGLGTLAKPLVSISLFRCTFTRQEKKRNEHWHKMDIRKILYSCKDVGQEISPDNFGKFRLIIFWKISNIFPTI